MKNKEIYTSALHFISQPADEGGNEDYEDRAPYLLANFCSEVAEIDSLARKFLGLPAAENHHDVWLSLDEDFPLLEKFAALAAKYVASMLVIDEDGELSDKLYEMYCDGISRIRSELPCLIESIKNIY